MVAPDFAEVGVKADMTGNCAIEILESAIKTIKTETILFKRLFFIIDIIVMLTYLSML